MNADEYAGWREREIDEYANEMARNGRFTGALAHEKAVDSYEALLPQGLETPGHAVWVGDDTESGTRIGFVWLGPTDDPTVAYVYSIEVDEPLRGRGYGKALMRAFEVEARGRGFTRVGLNVFGDNDVARHLYESLGYTEVSRQMAKSL